MRQTTTAQTSHLNVACLIFLSKADLYGYLPVRDCVILTSPRTSVTSNQSILRNDCPTLATALRTVLSLDSVELLVISTYLLDIIARQATSLFVALSIKRRP